MSTTRSKVVEAIEDVIENLESAGAATPRTMKALGSAKAALALLHTAGAYDAMEDALRRVFDRAVQESGRCPFCREPDMFDDPSARCCEMRSWLLATKEST
jgi:hypothetical protein